MAKTVIFLFPSSINDKNNFKILDRTANNKFRLNLNDQETIFTGVKAVSLRSFAIEKEEEETSLNITINAAPNVMQLRYY